MLLKYSLLLLGLIDGFQSQQICNFERHLCDWTPLYPCHFIHETIKPLEGETGYLYLSKNTCEKAGITFPYEGDFRKFQLHYFINGTGSGTLAVSAAYLYTGSHYVWSCNMNQGPRWNKANIFLKSEGLIDSVSHINIEATVTGDMTVAIGNISSAYRGPAMSVCSRPQVTIKPKTRRPTTIKPTTNAPTTTTIKPTTNSPKTTTIKPTTNAPTTTTIKPTTNAPTTTTIKPTTNSPKTTTIKPTTNAPTTTTIKPTTNAPTTITRKPTTNAPTTTTIKPTTNAPKTSTIKPTTNASKTTPIPQKTSSFITSSTNPRTHRSAEKATVTSQDIKETTERRSSPSYTSMTDKQTSDQSGQKDTTEIPAVTVPARNNPNPTTTTGPQQSTLLQGVTTSESVSEGITEARGSKSNQGVIIGGSVSAAVLVIVIVALIAVIVYKRRVAK